MSALGAFGRERRFRYVAPPTKNDGVLVQMVSASFVAMAANIFTTVLTVEVYFEGVVIVVPHLPADATYPFLIGPVVYPRVYGDKRVRRVCMVYMVTFPFETGATQVDLTPG